MDGAENACAGELPVTSVLLLEPDDADARRVCALLSETGVLDGDVVRVRRSDEALRAVQERRPSCLLLSATNLGAALADMVRTLVDAAPDSAVIVLSAASDDDGLSALEAGAQDCLVKNELRAGELARSLRHSAARVAAHQVQRHTIETRAHTDEQARLERGLLPSPIVNGDDFGCATYYRPGRDDAVLGGDFFDVVETGDGRLRVVIGDVMGHGPDEAALGVHLRVAWRTLLLAGVDDAAMLPTLGALLDAEQGASAHFATVCDIALDGDHATVRLAGHPAPIVIDGVMGASGEAVRYPRLAVGPPLGVAPGAGRSAFRSPWEPTSVPLPVAGSLMLFTDGLLEAFGGGATGHSQSLGVDELVAALEAVAGDGRPPTGWVPRLVAAAPVEPSDDIAAVVLTRRG